MTYGVAAVQVQVNGLTGQVDVLSADLVMDLGTVYRAVVSGGAEGALAPPEFGSSVNPIPTGGGRLCPPHYW